MGWVIKLYGDVARVFVSAAYENAEPEEGRERFSFTSR